MSDEYGYTKDQTREAFDAWYRGIGVPSERIHALWDDLQAYRRDMQAFVERQRAHE
jgi:hypothetical protein